MEYPSMYQAAVQYIKMGLAVFPLEERGKRPKTRNGFKDATTDAAQVKAWWQQWPNANIGIATGKRSGGIFVIDLDIDDDKGIDGYHTLEDWKRENGNFPDTWTAITGRGGYHLYFRSDSEVRNRAGIIDGVDVRGEGGYVVAPPSIHSNGNRYEWEYDPEEYDLSEANNNVRYFLETGINSNGERFSMPDIVNHGERNDLIFRFACMMQSKGASDKTVFAATMAENESKCNPPLEEKEVRSLVNSALRYEKGKPIHIDDDGVATQGWRPPIFATTDKGYIKKTIENTCEAIEYDEKLWGHIKYNELSYSPFVCGSLPWEHQNMYREWTNADDSNLKAYIEAKYGLGSMEKTMEALNIVVNRNKFNPVRDMLEDIHGHKWDRQYGHIRNLLPDYLGVEDNEYNYECMKLFMIGAISRAFYPGCKFDYMPVFIGKQGIGKSTLLRLLSMNNAWYNDNFNTIEGDKAPEKLRGMWMVELAELLATKKAKEVESIKAFLTSTVDTYRPPYGRRTEQRPRVCVFAGTTNNDHFLTDRTGNRRFLPIVTRKEFVKKSMFENPKEVQKDFENAWGEAMDIFKKANEHPSLILPVDLQEFVENKQAEYMEEDVRVGIIQEWLDNTEEKRVCVAMIYEKALGYDGHKPTKYESNELHSIMTNQIKGWERLKTSNGGRSRCGEYGTQICYVRKGDDENGFIKIPENLENIFD